MADRNVRVELSEIQVKSLLCGNTLRLSRLDAETGGFVRISITAADSVRRLDQGFWRWMKQWRQKMLKK